MSTAAHAYLILPTPRSPSETRVTRRALEHDLRVFLNDQTASWDDDSPPGSSLPGAEHLWNLPKVDSKAIARCSPIFKKHLGIRLQVKLIKPGGYQSIDGAINHLVPKMIDAASKAKRDK